MTFRALNNRVLWNGNLLSAEGVRTLEALFFDEGCVALHHDLHDLHDAMTEAGMIPARPIPTPDLTYSPPAETAWVADDRRQA